MKAEERIIELLAEYLKKGDQLLERIDRTDNGIGIMNRAIAEHSIKFNKTSDDIKQLREDQNRMWEEQNKLREEQGIMLKELVSLSRRVGVVEDKH
jgi:hypothetical protein